MKSPMRVAGAAAMSVALGVLPAACGGENGSSGRDQGTETSQPRNQVKLIESGTFPFGDKFVSVLRQDTVEIEGTVFDADNIKARVEKVAVLSAQLQQLPMQIGAGDAEPINLTVNTRVVAETGHGFAIVQDEAHVAALSGSGRQVPSLTVLMTDTNERISILAPVGQVGNRFDDRINADDFNLAVETCNNILESSLDQASLDAIHAEAPADVDPESIDLLMTQLTSEAVCNSLALAFGAKNAGISYQEYSAIAGSQKLQGSTSLGLEIPYIVYPEELWAAV